MNEGVIANNKNNFIFLGLLVLGLSFHLFLGKLIWDNIQSFGILVGIIGILILSHITVGRKLYHKGGVAQ